MCFGILMQPKTSTKSEFVFLYILITSLGCNTGSFIPAKNSFKNIGIVSIVLFLPEILLITACVINVSSKSSFSFFKMSDNLIPGV